ncbi:MAG: flagellar hook-basal body complex protein, partial [Planctomycetaceae bacterium]
MGNALMSAVSGLEAHQRMLDVAGDNLSNVNTTAFKSSRVSFASLLSETIKEASQPTATSGGTNPMQVGSGVAVASVDRDMTQGSMLSTGQPLDMAIDGAGYFVLNNGQTDLYTRVGTFAVDSQYYLVDPSTGYRVQRIGAEGVAEGFQDPSSNDIRIPYDIALPAKQTSSISYTGNLSADDTKASTNVISSGQQYTKGGAVVSTDTLLTEMDQASKLGTGDVLEITGTRADGTLVSANFTINAASTFRQYSSLMNYTAGGANATAATVLSSLDQATALTAGDKFEIAGTDSNGTSVLGTYTYAAGDTIQDMLDSINSTYSGATASIVGGQLVLTDDVAGASKTTFALTYDGAGTFTLPNEFDMTTAGAKGSTVGDLMKFITNAYSNPDDPLDKWSTASIVNGEIQLTDGEAGYSKTDISMALTPTDPSHTLELPNYFTIDAAGGEAVKTTNVQIFDSQGNAHELSASFVKTDKPNTWDMVLTSITGDVNVVTRRIEGITFLADGSFGGMGSTNPTFEMSFAHDPTNIRSITLDFGVIGEFNGLSQFGGTSTTASSGQDGYASGSLSTLSVSREGVLVGVFTNGV